MPHTILNTVDWDDLRYFLAAARRGSLTAAGSELGSNQPTVGRRIDGLERALGTRLFQRHAKGLTLTDEGRRIQAIAESIEDAVVALVRVRTEDRKQVRGTIRLALPEGIATHVVTPALPGFLEEFPQLDVVLLPSSASADLVHGEAEIAIRLFRPVEGDIVTRKLGEMKFGLYASRAYFKRHGQLRAADGWPRHRFVAYGERLRQAEENRWLEANARGAHCRLRSDDTHTRLAAASAGLGLAVLPDFLARTSGCPRLLSRWRYLRDLSGLPRIGIFERLRGFGQPWTGSNSCYCGRCVRADVAQANIGNLRLGRQVPEQPDAGWLEVIPNARRSLCPLRTLFPRSVLCIRCLSWKSGCRSRPTRAIRSDFAARLNARRFHSSSSTIPALIMTWRFRPEHASKPNPVESVWSHAKRTGNARRPLRKDESLEQRLRAQLDGDANADYRCSPADAGDGSIASDTGRRCR